MTKTKDSAASKPLCCKSQEPGMREEKGTRIEGRMMRAITTRVEVVDPGFGWKWVQRIPGFSVPDDWCVPAEQRPNKARGAAGSCARQLDGACAGDWDAK